MRSSIFSQIWIPLTLLTLVAVGMLVIYYPTKQRELFQRYKSEELQTIGRTIATEVEHALNQDDYTGLNKMMASLSDSSYLDCSALVFISEAGDEELSAVFPADYPLDIDRIDTAKNMVIKSNFSSKIGQGYILIGLTRAKLDRDIDMLNKPIFISFFFFASLIILVIYIVARSISRPILSLTEFALQLQRGQYKTFIDTKKPSSVELLSLNRSLNDLAVVLQSQQDSNEQLTENLEQQVKQKTENLQLAFNDLNTAQEIAQFANFSYDTENDTYKGSENLTKLLGIEAGGSNAFRPLLKCLKTEDIQEIEKQLRIAIKETNRFEIQVQWNRPIDQKIIWLDCIAYIYPGPNRKAIIRGVVQDITAKKQQQEELFILSNVAKRTSNLVILTDTHKCIQWVNESVLQVTGYTREELIGKTPRIFQSDQSNKLEIAKINDALSQVKPVWAELINVEKHGKPYWISINIVPIFNDKGIHTGFMAVETETTERKALELQREKTILLLEESRNEIAKINAELEQKVEERTRTIKNLALFPQQHPNPVLEFDVQNRHLSYHNHAALEQLGRVLDSSFDNILRSCSIDPETLRLDKQSNETKINNYTYEVKLFELTEDNILRVYLHDITERKKNEEELSRLISQLQQTESDLKQKTKELQSSL